MKTENRKTRMRPAQRDSKMSNLVWVDIVTQKRVKEGIFTMLIKNIVGCFMGYWRNEPMSKMQTSPAQRHSRMSNLKIETENSLPQRHSKMSIWDFGGIASAEHSKQAKFIERIKKIKGCFMGGRLSVWLCWPHGRETIKLKIESGKLKMEAWEEYINAKAVPLNGTPESPIWEWETWESCEKDIKPKTVLLNGTL